MRCLLRGICRHALYLAWVIALIGTSASLLWGEIWHHPPCPLCWYQRLFLFPLAIALGVASYRDDRSFLPYGLLFALIGMAIALFQFLDGLFPFLHRVGLCNAEEVCRDASLFIPPSLVSLGGFFLIATFLWLGTLQGVAPHDEERSLPKS